ncbi:MAG: carboxypeptidase regulatory-like domain-containing protein [Thermoplasmata archaeon]
MATAELHVCAFATGTGPCLENYVPSDGTSNARSVFYNICGFPDVFFDGLGYPSENGGPGACGASTSVPQMQAEYEGEIANASAYPGNVSISQSATITPAGVSEHADITSDIAGSYNAISYLVEYINQTNVSNGYGPHDLGYVVRSTLFNHPVTLTTGGTTEVNATGALNSSWNEKNLSVITFVQQNSTRIVENANMAPVTDLLTSVSAEGSILSSGAMSTISVRLTNSTTGDAVSGASVSLTSSDGGSFAPATGLTAADGNFSSMFTAPKVTSTQTVEVMAQATAEGYALGFGSTLLTINPLSPPTTPLGFTITPGIGQVTLNWSAPASGGGGVSYEVFQAATESGPYSLVNDSQGTTCVASGLEAVLPYWFEVDAYNSGGFSPNSTAIPASPVTVTAEGLPADLGWWISLSPTLNFSGTGSLSLTLYMPNGSFSYEYGAGSYAYNGTGSSNTLAVSGTPVTLNLPFGLRSATLEGTVTPAKALVSLDGTVLTVTNGGFSVTIPPGTYTLNVTAAGYQTNSSEVALTAGNTTTATVILEQNSASSNGSPSLSIGGLSWDESIALIAVAVVVVIGLALAIALTRRSKPKTPEGRSKTSNPPGPGGPPSAP